MQQRWLPAEEGSGSADPSKILGVKSSTGGFYDRIKERTRVFVFDDFAPDARATGEFLRLVSKTLSRDLNIKFGSVTCPFLSVEIATAISISEKALKKFLRFVFFTCLTCMHS